MTTSRGSFAIGPAGIRDRDGKVDHDQVRFELDAVGQQGPVAPHDERVAVEHELVLPPDLVDVDDGAAGLVHPLAQHGQSLVAAAAVVRRGVEVQHHVGPGASLLGHRTVGEPHVLTDRDTHPGPGHAEERGRLVARDEPALFVEDAVVGEEAFPVDPGHPPTGADGGGVGQAGAVGGGAHVADHDGTLPRRRGHLVQGGQVVGHEGGLEEEVLGRIARNGQLRQHAEVGAGRLGTGQRGQHLVNIAREVSDNGIELRSSDAQGHKRSLTMKLFWPVLLAGLQ